MDVEMAKERSFIKEEKTVVKDNFPRGDYMEEDSDAKMTLAVTSDEDSRDSSNNQIYMEKGKLRKSKENMMEKISGQDKVIPSTSTAALKRKFSSGSVNREISSESKPVKRKLAQIDWSSDEEDFIGFNEDGDAICTSRYKKAKETPEKEIKKIKETHEKEYEKVEEVQGKEEDNEMEKHPEKEPAKKIEEVKKEGEEVKSAEEVQTLVKEEVDGENKNPEEDAVQSRESPKPQPDVDKVQQSTQAAKGKTLKDPIFRKPFDMGWKREFVYRAIPGASKEKGEVYYISPSGKKLRTRIDVQQYLTPGLTLDNFTFAKEPLGFEEEVVRSAKPTTRSAPSTPVELNREPLGKRIPKPKAPKGASPPPQGWTAAKAVKLSSTAQSPRHAVSARPPDDEIKSTSKSKSAAGKPSKK